MIGATPSWRPTPAIYRPPAYRAPVQPQRVITRTVFTPGRTVYTPVYRTDYGAIDRARTAQQNYDRERFALERSAMHDRRAAERLLMLQQQLQQAQMAAQQAAAQQQQPVATAAVPQVPQAYVSPSSPAADLTPAQDAAAAASGGDDGGHRPHHMLLFGGLIAGAAVGGYFLLKKKKKSSSGG